MKVKCPKCESKNVMCVEYFWNHPEHYDGVSEIRCQDCKCRWGRWTGKILADDEYEKRFGGES